MSDASFDAREIAIRLRDLRKVYRLYRRPSYRIRDVLGLLPDKPRYFDEHVALHGVSLNIRRGEKVAIIGRNGAGKSTLLRLITRVIEPTSGTMEISGKTQALLSIGSGFHPELTGRQNVLAYLANFGIAGAEARRMLEEVIDFAELEEYIDQPTKTYSTGMGMRLMFSASIMFVPELLVIDEVLGVGDAYFQGKSFERIREVCSGRGTTLLLVTHDIYSATMLCERSVWIDNGAVLLDADSPTVLKAYEASIRQQEEARLRKKALMSLSKLADSPAQVAPMLIELRSPDNTPHDGPIRIGRIELFRGDTKIGEIPLVGDPPPGDIGSLVDGGTWGDAVEAEGRNAREMRNYGSAVHKVSVSFLLPRELAPEIDDLVLEIDAISAVPYRLTVWRVDRDMRTRQVGEIASDTEQWKNFRLSLRGEALEAREQSAIEFLGRASEVHGSGRVTVTAARMLDATGRPTYQIEHGQPTSVVFDYQINDPELNDECQIMIIFRRNSTDDIARVYCRGLYMDYSKGARGRITAKFDRLMIGAAEYSVTGLIAAAEYYEERQTIFFSINPKVYWAARNIFDFSVITDHYIPQGTGVVIEADWSLEPGLELAEEPEAEELELSLFGPEDAEIVDRKDGLTVRTARSNFTYALRTPNLVRSDIKIEPSAVVVDGWLEEGGLSIGLLDAERNEFVASGSMQQPGAFRYALEIDHIPEFYSVVFSNFREDAPGVSRFTLRRVRFAATEEVVG